MADQIGGRMIYWGSELIIGKMGRTHAPTFQKASLQTMMMLMTQMLDDDNDADADDDDDADENVFDPLDDADDADHVFKLV